MTKTDDDLRTFCHKHDIKVLDTNKRRARYSYPAQYFRDPNDYNLVNTYITHDTEPVFTVEIAESELRRVAEFECEVFNHMGERGHYNMFQTLMEQKEKEKYLRNKYPAVKKAYEQYSLMLKMAETEQF